MDDIIVFSTSLEEHLMSLRKVFAKLKEANLKLQLDKCEFLKKETEFLGHIITTEGIKPNPIKINAIKNFPIPKIPKQIKSFLGLCGFYRKFIPNFAKIAKPMTPNVKKGAKINSNDINNISAFEKFKFVIMSDAILTYPNFEKPFSLTTDIALGAVLSQDHKPICYASRTLNDHKLNYSAIEKELLAIVWATKYFRSYLFGRKFQILSDHRPLVWLDNIKEPNMKLQRWKIRLNEFDYHIKYVPGEENHVADALSRVKIENFLDETPSTAATIHSSPEDNQNYITIMERPINYYTNQIAFTRGNINEVKTTKYFHKTIIIITYKEMTLDHAKELIKEYICTKNTVIYFNNDQDFTTFQNAYVNIICPSNEIYYKAYQYSQLCSKFASLTEIKSRDWLEAKRAILAVFTNMGKPIEIKAEKDSAFMCAALQLWLQTEGVKIEITTSKNGISDIERFHKTINEKLRIINTESNPENKLTSFDTILYIYDHKTKHNTTGR